MDIYEVRKLKKNYENRIASAVGAIMEEFKKETGLSVEGVYINLVEITTHDSKYHPDYIISGAELNVKL